MRNVRDFGAVGDGISKDTAAIQRAIDAGGIVYFPPGTYLSGTLYLRSHGGLDLAPGAVLKASPDPTDYNAADFCPQNRASTLERASGGHLIVAVEQENIVIRGGGRIDGNRAAWLNEVDPARPVWFQWTWRPSQMLFFCECQGLWISDVELVDAPYWTCFLHGCRQATLRGLHIYGDCRVPNNDGIDIDCCHQVTISDCIINSADDCITLRGNSERLKNKQPCEYVAISNCVLASGYANAIRIGVGDGVIRHCSFNNMIIHDTRTAICVVCKYNPKRGVGTEISDISCTNFQLDVQRPFNVKLDNSAGFAEPSPRSIRRMLFSRMYGQAELSNYIHGNGVGCVDDIRFQDIAFTYRGEGPRPDRDSKGNWGRSSTHAVFDVRHAKNIAFEQVCIAWDGERPGWRYDLESKHSEGITHNACTFSKGVLLE